MSPKKSVLNEVVEIIDYEPIHQPAIKKLNYDWLKKYDLWEPIDDEYLDFPSQIAIDTGGFIMLARINLEIIGTVFFVPIEKSDSGEICKFCVSDVHQGKGIGELLLRKTIERARELGFNQMILYSNHKLLKALQLYQKVGFEFIEDESNHYETSDIKMKLQI